MASQPAQPTVEFTPEAEKALEERTKAFAEDLRLAAIEEAVRRRGTASEVTASDVYRAAVTALEQESLKDYQNRLDMLLRVIEEQSHRTRESAEQLGYRLRQQFEPLMGASKEREEQLNRLSQRLQEQSYANVAQLRDVLAHELGYTRSLAERAQRRAAVQDRLEKLAWLYVAVGGMLAVFGFAFAELRDAFQAPGNPFPALAVAGGVVMAAVGALFLLYKRFRWF